MKNFILLCAYMIGSAAAAAVLPERLLSPSYELILVDKRWPNRPFLVEVAADNQDGIRTLEFYIGNGVKLDPNGNIKVGIAQGKVVKTTKTPHHRWNFKLDPKTVRFQDMSIEVCDADFMYIENDIDKWIKEVGDFCPWSTIYWAKSIRKVWTK